MFGEVLTIFMQQRKVTIKEIADILQTSIGYVGDLRKGRYLPSYRKLKEIILALKLNKKEEEQLESAWFNNKFEKNVIKNIGNEIFIDFFSKEELKEMLNLYLKELLYQKYLTNSKETLDKIRKIECILPKIK